MGNVEPNLEDLNFLSREIYLFHWLRRKILTGESIPEVTGLKSVQMIKKT